MSGTDQEHAARVAALFEEPSPISPRRRLRAGSTSPAPATPRCATRWSGSSPTIARRRAASSRRPPRCWEEMGAGASGSAGRSRRPRRRRPPPRPLLHPPQARPGRHGHRLPRLRRGARAPRRASKLLHRGAAASDWLRREGRALGRLAHPHVVAVHAIGEHEGRMFLAMELVVGPSLRVWLEEEARPVQRRPRHAPPGRARPRRHPRRRPGPPRLQARQRARGRGRSRARGRLRHRRRPRRRGRHARRHPRLHGPRAAPRRAGEPGERPVQLLRHACTGRSTGSSRPVPPAEGAPAPPPARPDVPAWLGPILRRGLAADPAARFPSMHALLAAVEHHLPRDPEVDPAPVRREQRLVVARGARAGARGRCGGARQGRPRRALSGEWALVRLALVVVAVTAGAVAALWRRLSRNLYGRRVAAIFPGIGLALLVHRLVAVRLGTPVLHVLVVDHVILAVVLAATAVTVDRALGWFALLGLFGAAVSRAAPSCLPRGVVRRADHRHPGAGADHLLAAAALKSCPGRRRRKGARGTQGRKKAKKFFLRLCVPSRTGASIDSSRQPWPGPASRRRAPASRRRAPRRRAPAPRRRAPAPRRREQPARAAGSSPPRRRGPAPRRRAPPSRRRGPGPSRRATCLTPPGTRPTARAAVPHAAGDPPRGAERPPPRRRAAGPSRRVLTPRAPGTRPTPPEHPPPWRCRAPGATLPPSTRPTPPGTRLTLRRRQPPSTRPMRRAPAPRRRPPSPTPPSTRPRRRPSTRPTPPSTRPTPPSPHPNAAEHLPHGAERSPHGAVVRKARRPCRVHRPSCGLVGKGRRRRLEEPHAPSHHIPRLRRAAPRRAAAAPCRPP